MCFRDLCRNKKRPGKIAGASRRKSRRYQLESVPVPGVKCSVLLYISRFFTAPLEFQMVSVSLLVTIVIGGYQLLRFRAFSGVLYTIAISTWAVVLLLNISIRLLLEAYGIDTNVNQVFGSEMSDTTGIVFTLIAALQTIDLIRMIHIAATKDPRD